MDFQISISMNLFSVCYVPGTVLGIEDTKLNQILVLGKCILDLGKMYVFGIYQTFSDNLSVCRNNIIQVNY